MSPPPGYYRVQPVWRADSSAPVMTAARGQHLRQPEPPAHTVHSSQERCAADSMLCAPMLDTHTQSMGTPPPHVSKTPSPMGVAQALCVSASASSQSLLVSPLCDARTERAWLLGPRKRVAAAVVNSHCRCRCGPVRGCALNIVCVGGGDASSRNLSSCVTSNVNSRRSSLPDRSTSDLDNNASASSSVVFKPRAFKAARSSCVSMSELRSLSYLSKTALTRSGMFVGDAAVVAFDAGVHSCLGAPWPKVAW